MTKTLFRFDLTNNFCYSFSKKYARNTLEDDCVGRFCGKLSEYVNHVDHISGFKYVYVTAKHDQCMTTDFLSIIKQVQKPSADSSL